MPAKVRKEYAVLGEEPVITKLGTLVFVDGEAEITDEQADQWEEIAGMRVVRATPPAAPPPSPPNATEQVEQAPPAAPPPPKRGQKADDAS